MKHVLAAFAIVGLAAPALAQDADFAAVDADASLTVSWEELQAAMPEMTEEAFRAADADGSGDLSEEEFATLASE